MFLFGPIGSGKKHIAKLIHNNSKRSTASIIYLNTKRLTPDSIEEELFGKENTDGIPERIGLVEQAHNGTLYIDEASNLCKKSQRRLIKLLTENRFTRVNGKFSVEVDVRIITATSKNIQEMIKNNSFSEDLFYRLNVVPIKVPSLKERIEDIPDIIEYFLRSCSKDLGLAYRKLSREHYSLLQSMNLVGNLRQLKNIIENLLIIGQANNDQEISDIILKIMNNN